ncbi:MAG: DUF935 domain-containing protein [Candidatus Accumulibacter sp.]|jgi:phage gp29-like protein|nr:DUF935 domain-containing protein [Accumulibacter sp.]
MILDQYGQPIHLATLKTAQATPTPFGARKVGQHATTSGLDPLKAARILRQAEDGDAAAYLGIAEEMEEKYLHYGAQLATRKRAVSGIDAQIRAASEETRDAEIADFVRESLPVIQAASYDLLDALGKGYSVCEILWDTSGAKWIPRELLWRDPRWFLFDTSDGITPRLKSDLDPKGEALRPGHYVIHTTAAKSGLPIRGGLARGAIWAFLFHNFSIRDWVTFIEQFGKPLRLGRYDSGAATPADLDVLFEAVRSLGQDAAAILPRSMEIEFPEVANARGQSGLWRDLLEYLDRQVSKLVLGQTLTADTGESGGGSYALGNVHNDVRLDILKDDAQKLAQTINRDLIRILVDLNFAGVEKYPEYTLPVAEPEDLSARAAVVEKAVSMGYPVPEKWFSETFGIPLPEEGEAVLRPPSGGAPGDALAWASQRNAILARGASAARARHAQTGQQEHPGPLEDGIDALAAAAAPAVDGWLEKIKAALNDEPDLSPAELQEKLAGMYADLPTEQLVDLLTRAFVLAELRGRAAVEDGE